MGKNNEELGLIHKLCGWHEDAVLRSKDCGCFSCMSIFPKDKIKEWIDEKKDCPRGPGRTAVCPTCGIDAVIPEEKKYELNNDILVKMNKYYFGW